MQFPTENEIKALISLLSEKDSKNLIVIKDRLLEIKDRALPYLKDALIHENSKVKDEVQMILEKIRLKDLVDKWTFSLTSQEEPDLENGAFLYASYAFPSLEIKSYQKTLDHWSEDLKILLNLKSPDKNKFQIIHDYFFKTLGFNGNHENYYDPFNSYLPFVIENRKGLPITLSVVLLLVTRRLRLPFYPVGLPGHFLIKYRDKGEEVYVDPFNNGRILSREECIDYLNNSGYGYKEEFLAVAGPREILERMIRNLITVYSQTEDHPAFSFMTQLIKILHRSR